MTERFAGSTVAHQVPSRERQHAQVTSPSVDSDILSTSGNPSSLVEFDGPGSGWVLFSPQVVLDHELVDETTRNLDQLEHLDLNESAATTHTAADSSGAVAPLELPTHNGTGTFDTAPHRRVDLFERVNAWRIEQANWLVNDFEREKSAPEGYNGETLWKKIKESTVRTIEKYLAWDDDAIDALFSTERFSSDHSQEASHTASEYARKHYMRAQQYGPPGWEDRILRENLDANGYDPHSGILLAMLSRILRWSQGSRSFKENHLDRRSFGWTDTSPFQHADHSYHLDAIQGSIATLTSTMAAAAWSDSWDTGTSTSLGVAAA